MLRKYRFRTLAAVVAALLSVSPEPDFSVSTFSDGVAVAQPPQGGGPGGRGGRQGRQGGGNWNRQGGGNWNRQGGRGPFSPEQIIQSMTAERFERMRNNPAFAERMKDMVGADR